MGIFATVIAALWAMLPAYIPNNVAVLAGGGRPIDGGRTWGGKRLLGDGKTWRGTLAGTVAGTALALALNAINEPVTTFLTDPVADPLTPPLPEFHLPAAVGLALGAMLGDVVASFLKRRTGRERGAAFPGLDQLDFVVGALLCGALADFSWFRSTFSVPVLVVILVATPLLHVATNAIAYWLGVKEEPW